MENKRKISMKIISRETMKKSPLARDADDMLSQLTEDTAIEVRLGGLSSRTLRRAFFLAAEDRKRSIIIKTKGSKIYVMLKDQKKKTGVKLTGVKFWDRLYPYVRKGDQ
jgi:hypothetical protein